MSALTTVLSARLLVKIRAFVVLLAAFTLTSCQGSGTVKLPEASATAELPGMRLTLLSWNAQKVKNPRFVNDLSSLIQDYAPDMVFLQEAVAARLESIGMGGYFANGWSYPWKDGATVGVLTFARAAPMNVIPLHSEGREFTVTAPGWRLRVTKRRNQTSFRTAPSSKVKTLA